MSKKILVVDDDRDMVATLCDILELHGWEPIRGYNGEDAIELAAHHNVDVVLMDVRMPKVDGISALRQIKARRPSTRVVLMTAFAAQDLLLAAEREGALRILRKPIDLVELLSILDEARQDAKSVLVVDDDPDYLRSLSELLRLRGVNAVEASTLPGALERLERDEPAAVLLDLKLDHVDPRQSVLAIRELSPSVLLILYSGHAADLSRTIMESPPGIIDAAFVKPVPIDHLLKILDLESDEP